MASGKKKFEGEVGKSLHGCTYYYKPPDLMSNYNKVDYVAVGPKGIFIAIEAKETSSEDLFRPLTDASKLTPGQQMTLLDVSRGGGWGILAVNFGRKGTGDGLKSSRGKVGIWIINDWTMETYIKKNEMHKTEAPWLLDPERGGLWPFQELFRQLSNGSSIRPTATLKVQHLIGSTSDQ